MPGVVLIGSQWGGEGKGKVSDLLTTRASHIVRSQGGNNAGHTILIGDQEHTFHLIPCGIVQPHTTCYIGAGCVIDPEVLLFEINALASKEISLKERLWISPAAHVVFPYHRHLDLLLEKKKGRSSVGTTGRGIGPCFADKANRLGIRIADLLDLTQFKRRFYEVFPLKNDEIVKLYGGVPLSAGEVFSEYVRYAQRLAPLVAPVEEMLYRGLQQGENVLFEGAQGTFLDVSFGTYPFVTASQTTSGGILAGAGVGISQISHTVGVIKCYTTRESAGPFPSEVQTCEQFFGPLSANEWEKTANRKRRVGWLDAVAAKKAVQLNGLDSIALTKLDVLDSIATLKICVGYREEGTEAKFPYLASRFTGVKAEYLVLEGWGQPTSGVQSFKDLPNNAKKYVQTIETLCGVPISILSLGPKRSQTLLIQDPFEEAAWQTS